MTAAATDGAGSQLERGTLAGSLSAPSGGESFIELATIGNVRIEEIISSGTPAGHQYLQDHDEWVLLLDGAAHLDVAGEPVAMDPDDWVLLPAGSPHRVVATEHGTRWLTVSVQRGT